MKIWNLLLNKKKNELQYSTHLFINSMLNDFGYLFIFYLPVTVTVNG